MTNVKRDFLHCLVLLSFFSLSSPPGFCGGPGQAATNKEKITSELFQAAEKGDCETVKSLLAKYPDMKNARRNGG